MTLKVDEIVTGKVSGITGFGAFIDLGDHKNGLVHISEVSDGFIKDIHDVLNVGDEVKVKVMKIGDDGKIALSIRAASDKPQANAKPHHSAKPQTNSHRPHSSQPKHEHKPEKFDDLLSNFLKQSESRLSDIKKNTEGKRGGRGGRRS